MVARVTRMYLTSSVFCVDFWRMRPKRCRCLLAKMESE